jgi:hypothetical protein
MANQPKAHIDRLIRSMHQAGSGAQTIADALRADGQRPATKAGVYGALRRMGLVEGPPDETVIPTPDELAAGADDPETLADWHSLAAEGAIEARKRRDPVALARFVALGTTIKSAEEKNRPPPPVDPNERPDMIEAAKRARAKIFGLFDRLVAEARATK